MKSYHTIKKLSYILAGMGVIVSSHADTPITSCEFIASIPNETYFLDGNVSCEAGNSFGVFLEADDTTLEFRGNSLNLGDATPGTTIGVLTDAQGVTIIGPGIIQGGFLDNVRISSGGAPENGNNNLVRNLEMIGGTRGVHFLASGASTNENDIIDNIIRDMDLVGIALDADNGGEVADNNIIHNVIKNVTGAGESRGILLDSTTAFSSVNDNFIFHNDIENIGSLMTSRGVQVRGEPGSADNNRIENNIIKEVRSSSGNAEGVVIRSDDGGTANLNTVYNNNIDGIDRQGIRIRSAGALSTSNGNIVFLNRIFNTGDAAVALDLSVNVGTVALNSISWNFTDVIPIPRYCDDTNPGDFNNWGLNFAGSVSVFGPPLLPC